MPTRPKVSRAFFHSISVFWNFMIYQYIIRYSPWNVKPPVAHFSRISPIRPAFFRPFFRVFLNIVCNKFARLYKTNHLCNFRHDPAVRTAAAEKIFQCLYFFALESRFRRSAKRYKFENTSQIAFPNSVECGSCRVAGSERAGKRLRLLIPRQ